ncbi:hypothetical protein TCE0_050f18374 [Talaromyces pinophilus]|uniref:Uncharacterized protein n=1 Tax=Talaromyces pinophilus TaxID=128442 RepID=A0A0B8N2S8_TALPI|nr:hypothetical protein TCE0_050f18374 [Talaromyces pinophilus]
MFALIASLVLVPLSIVLGHRNGVFDQSPILSTTDPISPRQKAQLHEVADLMLDIYQTLVDMRYLDPVGVIQGPHNMTDLEPQFEELGIDPSIRYLYSILPYVDTDAAGNSDFLLEGEFTDFRDPDQVDQARDPFYASPSNSNFDDEDGPNMRPWYTPLSQLGNHGSVIVYDARRHLIWIIDQESWSTTDLALQNVEPKEVETANQNSFEHIPSRPAGDVLKDIVQWYRNLDILPGGGENSWQEWDHNETPLRDLYTANGWPDRFDADAFEINQARAFSRYLAQDFADRPINEVMRLNEVIERYKKWIETQTENLGYTTTKESEWAIRSRIWCMELDLTNFEEDLIAAEQKVKQLCPENVCLPPQEWPLWELQAVTERLESLKADLTTAESGFEVDPYEGQDLDEWKEDVLFRQKQHHLAKRKIAVYQKAYEAAREDAERLCPGQTFESVTGLGEMVWFGRMKEELRLVLTRTQREVELTREWLAQLPDDVPEARSDIESTIESLGMEVQYLEETLRE